MQPLRQATHRNGVGTLKQELKRFVYACDRLIVTNHHCPSTQVIDAVDERAADGIAKERGWSFDHKGNLSCKRQDHKKVSEKMGRPRKDPGNCDHNVVRVNEEYSVCTKCGTGGSQRSFERWAAERAEQRTAS